MSNFLTTDAEENNVHCLSSDFIGCRSTRTIPHYFGPINSPPSLHSMLHKVLLLGNSSFTDLIAVAAVSMPAARTLRAVVILAALTAVPVVPLSFVLQLHLAR